MKKNLKKFINILIIIISLGSIIYTIYYAKEHINNFNNPPFSNNTEAPPSKPDGNSSDNLEEPPSKKDDDSSNTDMQMPNKPNDLPDMKVDNNALSYKYYIIFGIESCILSISIICLLNSNKETKNKSKSIIYTITLTLILTVSIILLTNNVFLKNNNNDLKKTTSNITYSAKTEITEDTTLSEAEYSSSNEDENAIAVSGNINVNLSNIKVTKTGDSNGGDNTSFYGTNSAIIAKDGANLTLKNITVTTDAQGANGIFIYGGSATTQNSSSDGTTINISDSTITTSKDNSGGIMTTGGGIMNASNLTINTAGISSAAIRTDRGGGTVNVDGGSYTTTNQGSPTIYSTANVTVSNANLISKASEGIVIEGKNSVSLDNVTLTDTNSKLNGKSTTYKNIFLYQSMSGDADTGTSKFDAKNSKITTNKGDTLYITNTTATINLENNTIINNDETGNFLRAQADSWGEASNNGGIVTLVMSNQKVSGNVVIDSISTLDMTLNNNSYYEGTINSNKEAKSITLTLDKTSKIKLTGDSYITNLNNADSTNSNIDFNGYKLYVNGKAIN